MGEIADDMISGRCCALCGQYFVSNENTVHGAVPDIMINANDDDEYIVMYEHGYPVACEDCWDEECGYQKATHNTY